MNDHRYYVTTAIPYVNASPHIGHATLLILTDVLARYHRQRGDDTRFLTGTDDNSLTNVLAAEAEGLPVKELVDRNAAQFAALRRPLALSFDDFIRTSADPRHAAGARRLWAACDRAGDIYTRAYRGLYCVRCERFYSKDELTDGLCPVHRRALELVEEKNYFFRLSRYAGELIALIESERLRILPGTRRNEVLRFIRGGLEDFSISRSQARARGWGIPVPGDPTQVMYVWWDALTNYITALDYADDGALYRRYWRDAGQRVHVIGKDLLRFHAIYWPAMLLSAGEPPPTLICAHEFLTVEGEKISKSLGNSIDPVVIARRFGIDALRYWLLRELPRTEDADFTPERLVARYNTDLANDLGNLLNRTVSMIGRYAGGVVPEPGAVLTADLDLIGVAERLPARVHAALEDFDFRAALAALWELVVRANRYVEETAPWVLARRANGGDTDARRRLDTVLYTLAESLRLLAHHLAPFLPVASDRIAAQLGIPPDDGRRGWPQTVQWGNLALDTRVAAPRPIFPKIEPAVEGGQSGPGD